MQAFQPPVEQRQDNDESIEALTKKSLESLTKKTVRLPVNMTHSLNSLKGGYIGDYMGVYYRGYLGGYMVFSLNKGSPV